MTPLDKEKKVISLMIDMYCYRHHSRWGLCDDCRELTAYAFYRIENCRFGTAKPNCNDCTVHCFGRPKREEVRRVMRYAGPRMLWHHPYFALWHMLRRKKRST